MTLNRSRTLATILALVLVVSAAAPAALAQTESSVDVAVEQAHDTGDVIVTVSENGTAIENASIDVTTDGNYSIGSNVTTDANGTAVLPAPDETIEVTVTATVDNVSVSENATLAPLADSLSLTVGQTEDLTPTVTVTQYDDPVANASVQVASNEDTTYAGAGTYSTGENGTAELPVPEADVNVTVTTSIERSNQTLTANWTGTLEGTAFEVSANQNDDGELEITVTDGGERVDGATVTVSVVGNGTYAYADTYEAENGTLTLPAPTENVTVDVLSTFANESDTATVDLLAPTDENPNNDFAESLVRFIHFLQVEGTDGPLGQEIAEFVHEHNPAPDNARGPPEHAGPPQDGEDSDEREGNVTAAEDEDDGVRGPPEHANGHGAPQTEREHEQNRTQDASDDEGEDVERADDYDAEEDADENTAGDADDGAADREETDGETATATDAGDETEAPDGEESDDDSRHGNGPPAFVNHD
ncbi:MAG: DNA primase [Halanaeroarchaeum sp.]